MVEEQIEVKILAVDEDAFMRDHDVEHRNVVGEQAAGPP